MVPETVRPSRGGGRIAALAAAGALSLSCGACRGRADAGAGADTTLTSRAVAAVRGQYTARDAVAAGAWSWTGADTTVWVLVDVESTVQDLVEARLDLWGSDGTVAQRIGRSDVMPAAAGFAAWAFADLTGDGIPDFFGTVADSTGESFPVFVPGVRGAMGDELELAAHGWRFSADENNPGQVVAGPHGPCALQLWAEAAPDSSPAGWRWLSIGPRGTLGAPAATAPVCS